ncbi:MAG: hypothetical protein NTZ05_04940, partial [Chloroflexi bacterium]|nr:hypothetical protein [Chloroflexota bacterium]
MLREYRKPVRVALLAVSLLTLLGVPARSEWSAGGMARTASADNKYTNTATVKEGPPHSSDANVTVNADFSAGAADASERKLTMKLFGHGAITRRIGDSPSARTESFCSPLAGTLDGSDVQTTCPLVTFPISDDVTLNAQPNAGYIFAGWSGTGVPATCTSAPAPSSCTAPAGSSELDFTARFDTSVLTLHVVGHTAGTAPTIGDPRNSISCAADTCTKPIVPRTTIDLGVIQDAGYQFIGWSGAGCSGKTDCLIRMDSTDEVTATFAAITTATLTYKWNAETTPTRGGFLQTSPTFPRTDPPSNGINCGVIPTDNGGSCSATYPIGTTVTLTA